MKSKNQIEERLKELIALSAISETAREKLLEKMGNLQKGDCISSEAEGIGLLELGKEVKMANCYLFEIKALRWVLDD